MTLACSAQPAVAQDGAAIARAYREAHEAEILRDFAALLAIPNVASDSVGIHANADYIAAKLREVGVATELWKLPGSPPAIYGELIVPGATRTLGIYVHYDGQPVDASQWVHPAWEPTLYTAAMPAGGQAREFPAPGEAIDPEWRIYARSAGDDKAPLGALLPVLRAFREADVTPTSNLKFLFDGEEEAGSDRLDEYLSQHRAQLDDIDVWLFFDGPVHQSRRPLLTFGVRGVVGMQLTVYGADRELHSGHYGNWAPDPGMLLAHLLASMKDPESGEVRVAGFYDDVAPLGDEERDAIAAFPDYDSELKREFGIVRSEGAPATLTERLLLPSLTIHGLASANVGRGARNIVPAVAQAAIGIRMVQGNDPERMVRLVEDHIRAQGYHIVREEPDQETRLQYPRIARVTSGEGYPAARTSMGLPIVQEVIAAARQAAGAELLLIPGLGGSLPLYLFTEQLARPAVIVPIANHDNNQHGSNENLRIANLWYGIDLYGALLTMAPRPLP